MSAHVLLNLQCIKRGGEIVFAISVINSII